MASETLRDFGNGIPRVPLAPGTGIALLVDGTRFETETIYPLVDSHSGDPENASDILLEPYPRGGKSRDDPEAEIQFLRADSNHSVAFVPDEDEPSEPSVDDGLCTTLLRAAAKLAEHDEHELADDCAASAIGYRMEVRHGE